jgi:hypothetical protein
MRLFALFLLNRAGRQVRSFVGEVDMKQAEAKVDKALS